MSNRGEVCGYSTHKSLDIFSEKYSNRILDKYLIYTKDLKKDADILMLPVYMLFWISENNFRKESSHESAF